MKKLFTGLVIGLFLLGLTGYASAGTYYEYADFTANDGFQGGFDVDSYGNYLYVNNGNQIDRYTVTTTFDPTVQVNGGEAGHQDVNTHPDNIGPDGSANTADDNVGAMAVRTLTYDKTYSVTEIGFKTQSEIFAAANGLYFLDDQSDVSFYDFSAATVSKITATSDIELAHLTRAADGTWYASDDWHGGNDNKVYKYDNASGSWEYLFTHSVVGSGSHLDGLAIASLDITPNDNIDNAVEFLFAADMTSDNITRTALDGSGLEVYTYHDTAANNVEGMGFGANGHFWATGSGHLYEIGGGALEYVHDGPEPATLFLMGLGLLGLVGYGKKKKFTRS